jgi:NTP pyrophosphatase (non-canonical NTP hydrolase)
MALKLSEECGETAQAVLSYTKTPGCANKGKTKHDVIEEACDCIIAAGSLIYKIEGHADSTVEKIIRAKLKKWIRKSKKS